ncbi:MAG: histidine phosphatase family protein, partial [Alphaproteobacteria bacterium]|nr:histidine phosphatase family protein [Alphaproteobacteria bacterium]
ADGETLFDVITDHAHDLNNILLIGHNPGLIILMHILLAEDGNRAQKSISDFPTASLAEMVFEAPTIGQITRGSGTLVSLMRPRDALE